MPPPDGERGGDLAANGWRLRAGRLRAAESWTSLTRRPWFRSRTGDSGIRVAGPASAGSRVEARRGEERSGREVRFLALPEELGSLAVGVEEPLEGVLEAAPDVAAVGVKVGQVAKVWNAVVILREIQAEG
ncbi:MAG: hypothetical protein OEM15_19290 [Myxococcales bacterium]|nr:hypothetical protein [Myxococcales bacterium]